MRLITHNMLKSSVRGVEDGYPLAIEAEEVETEETEFNQEFIEAMVGKLEWGAFVAAATTLGVAEGLPEELSDEDKGNGEVLQRIHHALLEVHVITGFLVCPSTGRKFKVHKGIPNMLLHEDEVVEDGAAAAAAAPAEAAAAASS
uniref:Multifunctional methyltransferase subunit TRM112-like protein n=1 Tax=Phaeomonas parva TaxID=124430 RepID=A0A7S1TWS9_9STRA|mmetsp:Transcript_18434/g.56326  ORF Transcript_18434/g.56326 Transcript_18434/m.56326 type:complete len:145 (+) Transcript_18434:124-558(+)|eukprot:CAMPEP_0118865138 /NCGR_PEP_ID=MMETSP1163-20130328/9498_1 /TAXON_ID=124430 /ORGANISM="Phaeomonas parva, Strain CCMP2877" /LENGTH=144 /DNA_ID=CAMNT_0006799337 /DNA_START=94 /DNA_END=528 /DNA_ORIENTATION=-